MGRRSHMAHIIEIHQAENCSYNANDYVTVSTINFAGFAYADHVIVSHTLPLSLSKDKFYAFLLHTEDLLTVIHKEPYVGNRSCAITAYFETLKTPTSNRYKKQVRLGCPDTATECKFNKPSISFLVFSQLIAQL